MTCTRVRVPLLAGSAAIAALALAVTLPAATPRMGIEEIAPGMRGVGVTVFAGAARERFDVELLGVLANVMGPRRTLIIARLAGGPLADTGVIQGMSGSPVYVDGRLIGAISYALGAFSTEAIAGITPIGEMTATDATQVRTARLQPLTAIPPGAAPATIVAAVRQALAPPAPFAPRPESVRAAGLPGREAARLARLLRPIATPVVLNGFAPEIHDLWAAAFDGAGIVTALGAAQTAASAAAAAAEAAPLQPGDPIGASLIQGDFTMAGAGTVTLVEDGRVYAFGHPFYNLGETRLPMTRARITTLLPSLAISSKIAAIGPVIGTIDQDRSTGIYGSLGAGPPMIPVTVSIAAGDRRLDERFAFEIIDDRFFTPLLTLTGVLNTFFAWTRDVAPSSTYDVAGTARLRGREDVSFRNVFAGPSAGFNAALSAATPLMSLLGNRFEPVGIDGIDLTITAHERPRTARLERVWIDADRPRAGDVVPVRLVARTADDALIADTVPVALPRDLVGPAQILVADAAALRQREAQSGRQPQQARSLPQLIRALNRARTQDRWYVQLIAPRPGAVVDGAALAALPPSVLAVLDADRAGGDVLPLREAILGEWDVPTGHVVSGSRRLALVIEAG